MRRDSQERPQKRPNGNPRMRDVGALQAAQGPGRIELLESRIQESTEALQSAEAAGNATEVARLKGLIVADRRSLQFWKARAPKEGLSPAPGAK